jgi:UDP-N-acetylglucosamine--N-acetylmuramyl-(pentapeptide) pyrophosphoryl-undecaprenol N-acetylglucosamine transferase
MASTSPLFLFAGGGTGGHLFPGLSIAQTLRRRDAGIRIQFVGSERSLERALVIQHGYDHRTLPSEPLNQLWRKPWSFGWRNWRAFSMAYEWLQQDRPSAVIGLGGFASAPIVMAANRLGIPALLLEQNAIPGRSTRWLSRWARVVCLSYPQSVAYFNRRIETRLTGNPIRAEIAALATVKRVEATPPTVLILGGSQGAQALNAAVIEMWKMQPPFFAGWNVIHQTGVAQCAAVQQSYQALQRPAEVAPFFHDMDQRYQSAQLIISRAGATTLAELACTGVPAVLVPYPSAADNHQWHNAQAFEEAGAARTCLQRATPQETARELIKQLTGIADDPARRAEMSEAMRSLAQPSATEQVVEALHQVIARSGSAP